MWFWTKRKLLKESRERLAFTKARYGDLYSKAEALFFKHDPIGINFKDNIDEYEPEVGTVLPRLESCRNPHDVASVLHEEFTHWFTAESAGPREVYEPIAVDLWQLWQDFKPISGSG